MALIDYTKAVLKCGGCSYTEEGRSVEELAATAEALGWQEINGLPYCPDCADTQQAERVEHDGLVEENSKFKEMAVSLWNAACPPGTPVRVETDEGDVVETVTRSVAWMLGDTPVVKLDGYAGGYALTRIRPINRGD